jgi:hypothetical protein
MEALNLNNFDTHKAIKRLCAAGMNEAQAEEITNVIMISSKYDLFEVATKNQVEQCATKEQHNELKKDVERCATKEQHNELRMDLNDLRKDVERCATKEQLDELRMDLNDLRKDVEQCATKEQLNELKKDVERCATKEQLNELRMELNDLRKDVEQCATKEQLNELRMEFEVLKKDVRSLEKLISQQFDSINWQFVTIRWIIGGGCLTQIFMSYLMR